MDQQPEMDHFFRQRLYDAEAPPPAFVWDNVERALRRRRRRFFLWLFASGLLGGALVATWFWNETAAISTRQVAQSAKKTESATALPPAAALPAETPAAKFEAPPQHPPAPVAPARPQARAARAANLTAPAVSLLPPAVPADDFSEKNNAAETPAQAPALDIRDEQYAGLLPLPVLFSLRTAHPVFPADHFKTPPARKRKPKKKNCYDFEKHANVWLLDAYAGPAMPRKILRADDDNLPYLNRRLGTERRDWFAYNAGLRASWLFNRNFLLRAGLHYEQFTEVFEFIDPNSVTVTVEYRTELVNGQPVTVADTVAVDFGENYVKTYNRFGLLDIPVAAGVELRRGNAGLSLNAGASLNLLFWKRGDIIAPGVDAPIAFTPGHNGLEVFRPRVGLSLSGSAQFFYHLRPRLRVFAEPYFRHILQPVNLAGHPVEQRYNIAGVRFGVTKILD